ncbi:MAG: class I tRNA ligase family protein [Nanoarchaeota archaeon]
MDPKIKNCIIIHGSPSKDRTNESDYKPENEKHWISWIKNELEEREVKTATPQMPTPWAPKYEEWKSIMNKFDVNENTLLIGHSAGGAFIVRWLYETKKKIRKLILVSPGKSGHEGRATLTDFYGKGDYSDIKKNIEKIVIFTSEDDINYHIPIAYEYKEELAGKLIHLGKGYGHFCEKEMGKKEFPELFNEIFEKWAIFTTRADTLMGVTFLVVSAQHSKLDSLVTKGQKKEVDSFLKKIKSTSEKDAFDLEKEGVFTGSYAVHPISGDKIPVWAGNFVVADYGSGMVMAVPAHDQRDFEFAQKYKIPIKQVIAPLFVTTEGKDAIRKDKPMIKRDTVFCIVKHWKEDKYLCLDWKKEGWKTFVVGGVEKGENLVNAGMREIREETGYQNIKFIKSLGWESHNKFFASHKDENRHSIVNGLCFELKDGKTNELDNSEKELRNIIWVEKNKVINFINLENNKYVWNNYLNEEKAFTDYGVLVNSGAFDGLLSDEAITHITKELQEKKKSKFTVNYKLRDWLISRQRYWGTPIPVVYCDKCGMQPVNEKDLPILLPEDVTFDGNGNPMNTSKSFQNAKCPKCNGKARRDIDTMDTFFDSSWYYLRYCDNLNEKKPFEKEKAEYWLPVDFYTGGAEHACMHLIYARFFTKVLRDLGYVKLDEPFKRLFNQGMVHGEDGVVMSKSRGNVIDPLDISRKYGADALRIFLVSLAGPEKDSMWSSTGIESMARYINKIYSYSNEVKFGKSSRILEHKLNKAILDIGTCIEDVKYNIAVIKLRELFDSFEGEISKEDFMKFIKILSPFCPHIAEELWEKVGGKGFVSLAEWPKADESKIDEKIEQAEKNVEKTVSDVLNVLKIIKEKQGKDGEKIYLYVLPNEFDNYNLEILTKRIGKEVKVYAVNDKSKYDPEGKAGKTKPGKPGIFVE